MPFTILNAVTSAIVAKRSATDIRFIVWHLFKKAPLNNSLPVDFGGFCSKYGSFKNIFTIPWFIFPEEEIVPLTSHFLLMVLWARRSKSVLPGPVSNPIIGLPGIRAVTLAIPPILTINLLRSGTAQISL